MNNKTEQDRKEESLIWLISKQHRKKVIKKFLTKLKREVNEIVSNFTFHMLNCLGSFKKNSLHEYLFAYNEN